ncbi:MAG: GNAT family N-acetyltransferase [Methanomicrobium sp.]|nr:GNAT family N-acetyltransferase [Methanomicrobium sp.]
MDSVNSLESAVSVETVTFREFRRSDRRYLEDLLYDLWLDNILKNNTKITHGEDFAGLSKVKGLIARDYLLIFLKHSSYSVTAVNPSGIPCGYLLGRCTPRSRGSPRSGYCDAIRCLSASLRQYYDGVILRTTKYGRIYLEHRRDTQRALSTLERSVPAECEGELILFAVRSDIRGKGIGSRLIADFQDYLRRNGCGGYYLCADDYCNTGYYEKHGYMRVASTDVDYKDGRKGMKFHLYVRDL